MNARCPEWVKIPPTTGSASCQQLRRFRKWRSLLGCHRMDVIPGSQEEHESCGMNSATTNGASSSRCSRTSHVAFPEFDDRRILREQADVYVARLCHVERVVRSFRLQKNDGTANSLWPSGGQDMAGRITLVGDPRPLCYIPWYRRYYRLLESLEPRRQFRDVPHLSAKGGIRGRQEQAPPPRSA